MIGIIGYMSGGKSYTAVELMLHYMHDCHRVASNIRLNCKAVSSYLDMPCVLWKQYFYLLSEIDSRVPYNWLDIADYSSWPMGTLRGSTDYEKNKVYIFLDEVSSLFDSMVSSADGGIQAVATWARHSEKRGQMLYLIMQFPSELHKRLRVHITSYLECTNTNSVKIPLLGLGVPFFLRNMIIRRDLMPDLETVVGSATWSRLNPQVFTCYNTGQIVVGHNESVFRPVNSSVDVSEQRHVELLTRLTISFIVLWLILGLISLRVLSHGN